METGIFIIAALTIIIGVASAAYGIGQAKQCKKLRAKTAMLEEIKSHAIEASKTIAKQRDRAEEHVNELSLSLRATEGNLAELERSHRTLKGNYTRLKAKVSAQGAAAKKKG